MGLPIFFEPSTPDLTSKQAEKSASEARSAIRRRNTLGNESRTVYNARRRRALDLENYDGHFDALSATISTPLDLLRRNHLPRLTSTQRLPAISRHDRQPAGRMEVDGPSMPAVPESRDYITLMDPAVAPLPPSRRNVRRLTRRLMRIRSALTPDAETGTSFVSQSRTSSFPEGIPRETPPSETNDRTMEEPSPPSPVLLNITINTPLAERMDVMNSQDSSPRRDGVESQSRRLVRDLQQNQRRQARGQEEAERAQEETTRVRDNARERQRQDDEPIREERHVLLRVSERGFEEVREYMRANINADRLERQRDIHNTLSETQYLAHRRAERERARERLERAWAQVTRSREQVEEFDRRRGQLSHIDSHGFTDQIEQSSIDGLGDRERSLSLGDGTWDNILITPDPQPPSASSSFASTAASRPQLDSAILFPSSIRAEAELVDGAPEVFSRSYTYPVPINVDCDTISDTETEDEPTDSPIRRIYTV